MTSGRHRQGEDEDLPWYESRRPVRRRPGWMLPAAGAGVAVLLVIALIGAGSLASVTVPGRSTCDGPRATATVAAAPDHAEVLRRIAAEWSLDHPRVNGACADVEIVAAGSATVASTLGSATPAGRPDAWAPESAVWPGLAVARPEAAAALPAKGTSLATTPVVIAVPRERATALGWPARKLSWRTVLGGLRKDPTWKLYGHPEWGRFVVGLSDPTTSTAALHTLLAVTDGDADGAVEPSEVSNELLLERSVGTYGTEAELLARAGGKQAASAFAATEQAVLAHNASAEGPQLVPVYPADGIADADHPFLTLRGPWVTAERRAVAQAFADFAVGPAGRAAYRRAGVRDRDRSAAEIPAATADARAVAKAYKVRPLPVAAQTAQALVRWRALRRPANVLAVIDTSGSMAEQAPGLPVSKLAVFQKAAAQAIQLFNARSRLGMWEFSSRLDGARDYRQLVPPRPLGAGATATQRRALAGAVGGMRPVGATGLYDTIDASYKEVSRIWRKDQQNILVVMTDGKNEDTAGLSMPALVQSLRASRRADRPVTVILIAYGQDADVPALTQAATAAGGRTYVARDPADIGKVFLAAMVNR